MTLLIWIHICGRPVDGLTSYTIGQLSNDLTIQALQLVLALRVDTVFDQHRRHHSDVASRHGSEVLLALALCVVALRLELAGAQVVGH